MNQTQLNRIELRINQAVAAALTAFVATLPPEPDVIEYTDAEKVGMIRTGVATLKTPVPEYRNELVDFFDYPPTTEMQLADEMRTAWDRDYEAERNRLNTIKERLLDEAILSKDGMAVLDKIAAAFNPT